MIDQMPATLMQELNKQLAAEPIPENRYAAWRTEVLDKDTEFPMSFPRRDDVIVPQHAIQVRIFSRLLLMRDRRWLG